MKALITALAITALCGTVSAADLVGKRTPNGGFEYYTSTMVGQGSIENGCYLPKQYEGHPTLGYNPKRVEAGDITVFVDCFIQQPVVAKAVVVAPAPVVVAPAPVYVAPAPAPAYVPAPQPKRVRE